jgi:hypothetical protein
VENADHRLHLVVNLLDRVVSEHVLLFRTLARTVCTVPHVWPGAGRLEPTAGLCRALSSGGGGTERLGVEYPS